MRSTSPQFAQMLFAYLYKLPYYIEECDHDDGIGEARVKYLEIKVKITRERIRVP